MATTTTTTLPTNPVAAAASTVANGLDDLPSNLKRFPFQGFIFFTPWVTSYTGSKKLMPEDIVGDGEERMELPPEDLASLGSMHTCNPKLLAPFESMRNSMVLACLEFGVRCLNGFAVPRDKANIVAERLNEIVDRFYTYKSEFLTKFVLERESWLSNPAFSKWTDRIRKRLHSVEYVNARIHSGYEVFTIGDLKDLGSDGQSEMPALAAGALKAASGILASALDEIASVAKTTMRESFHDKSGSPRLEVTQKILAPFRRIRDKCEGLGFADPRLTQVSEYIVSVLSDLPKSGKMDGKHLNALYSLCQTLADPDSILRVISLSSTNLELSTDDQKELFEITTVPQAAGAPADTGDGEEVSDDAAPQGAPSQPAAPTDANMEGESVFDDF